MSHDPHDERVRQFAPDPFWRRHPRLHVLAWFVVAVAAIVVIAAIAAYESPRTVLPAPAVPVEVP